MGTKEKLIERFKALPSDFTFDELEKFLKCFGYEKSNKGKTSGSRVVYKNKDKRPIMLHKPHPGDQMVKGAVESVVVFLREHGHI